MLNIRKLFKKKNSSEAIDSTDYKGKVLTNRRSNRKWLKFLQNLTRRKSALVESDHQNKADVYDSSVSANKSEVKTNNKIKKVIISGKINLYVQAAMDFVSEKIKDISGKKKIE